MIKHIVVGGSGKTRLSQEVQDELISSIRNGQYEIREHRRTQGPEGQVLEKTYIQIKHGPTVTVEEIWPAPADYSYIDDYLDD